MNANSQFSERMLRQHALCWGAAILAPPIVLVALDLFDRHTPTLLAVFSSIILMLLFGLSHGLLRKGLSSAALMERES
ncbi:MAG: hypothetical protein KDB14_34960 [Planctomycetales bacterium]|nr:hypothetical protein [Planctomycetales bacterium]